MNKELSGQPDRRARFRKCVVYVLWFSKDNTRYVGQTDNLYRRIKDHLTGKVEFSKSRRPFKLIYVEKLKSRSEAIKRENYLKSKSGRRYLDKKLFK